MKEDNKDVPLGFPTNKDLLKKLDFISGTINTIEGIVRKIRHDQTLDSVTIVKIWNKLNEQQQQDKSSFHFSKIKIENIIIEGRITKFIMNEFQFVDATFEAVKKNGKPAKVENPKASTDNEQVLTAEIIDDHTARFTAVEGFGDSPVAVLCKVTADADLGEGVREIEVVGSVTVT